MIIDKSIVLLQNCMDLQKDTEGPRSETCPTSRDAYQATSVKVEDVSDTEQEEDPVPLRYSGIKMEHMVSCMSVCHCKAHFTNIQNSLLTFSSPSLSVFI
jgi:hypothetical protein